MKKEQVDLAFRHYRTAIKKIEQATNEIQIAWIMTRARNDIDKNELDAAFSQAEKIRRVIVDKYEE